MFQLERTEKSVIKFENVSGLRCARMNKIASLILDYNRMCEFPKCIKAFLLHSCKYSHRCIFLIVLI